MLALMDDDERAKYQESLNKQGRQAGGLRFGSGLFDFFGGRKQSKALDTEIDDLSTQASTMRDELNQMRAPGSMDPSTVAEATRNAAILGFQSPAEDPSDLLAAQAMSLESGADPSKLYSSVATADATKDAQAAATAQNQFSQGLEMAQTDALNRFKQDYQEKADELNQVYGDLDSLQNEKAAAEARKAQGGNMAVKGASQYLQSGGLEEIKALLGGEPEEEDEGDKPGYGTVLGGGTNNDGTPDYDGDPTNSLAYGGSVQQTPGEYDHDTNDLILMAQGKDGQLVDTGIRQTGGEFVIDPFDAGNMRQAHEKIDPVELEMVRQGRAPLSEDLMQRLMQMYDAVRFINEPQFKEDYYEKKMNGYA